MSIKRALIGLGVAILGTASVFVVVAAPAAAAGGNGVCDPNEFCLYYNSDTSGSLYDFTGSLADYGTGTTCRKFVGAGAGKGQCIKNNAASAWNRTAAGVTIFRKSGNAGSIQAIPAITTGNLNGNLKNNNAGHLIGYSNKPALSYSLYQASGGAIECYFDGYLSTPGRHEGIDIARSIGSQVHALVGGKVVNIVRGGTGGDDGDLSTIAIYNATLSSTVIYLHTAPLSSLAVGQSITAGQVIAAESWRGVSSESAAHTHVEMRTGNKTLAAKSVNDYTLSNPNPTSFWRSRGYNIW